MSLWQLQSFTDSHACLPACLSAGDVKILFIFVFIFWLEFLDCRRLVAWVSAVEAREGCGYWLARTAHVHPRHTWHVQTIKILYANTEGKIKATKRMQPYKRLSAKFLKVGLMWTLFELITQVI